mmetsp:Transcript_122762/g.261983  ORF Transcript_122762/g.261983 Transcript_122762/m.261983 type:complete len:297 (-) Transcript_122762:179-1069(-)
MHPVVLELSHIFLAILGSPDTGSMLTPMQELALIDGSVRLLLDASPVLLGHLPLALVGAAVRVQVLPMSVGHILAPLARVLDLVLGQVVGTFAVLHILLEATLILGTRGPFHDPLAVHAPIGPLADVSATISEVVATLAMEAVICKLPLIPNVGAHVGVPDPRAVPGAEEELTRIPCPIEGLLDAPARLAVLNPLALILAAIRVDVRAMTVSLVPSPLAIVRAAAGLHQEASTVPLVALPLARVVAGFPELELGLLYQGLGVAAIPGTGGSSVVSGIGSGLHSGLRSGPSAGSGKR